MKRLILVQSKKLWLIGAAAGLMVLHLSLTWNSEDTDLLSMSLLFWLTVLYFLWDKHQSLILKSNPFSVCLGTTLIALVLLKSFSLSKNDPFLQSLPFISVFSLALVASGFRGLRQYWQELLLLFALMLPLEAVLPHLIEVATLTAKFATFILWHLGFDVSRQGINLLLPDGAVAVTPGCSGLSSIVRLLRLTVLVLVLFPTTWPQKVLLPLVAVGIAFVVNGIRVVVMAIVVTANQQAFTYWHEGVPARTFSFISILIFGLFCHLLIRKNEPQRDLVEL